MTSTTPHKKSKSNNGFLKQTALSVIIVGVWISILNTIAAGDPLTFLIPNFLLFTPFHHLATPVWRMLQPAERLLSSSQDHKHTPIPEIKADDYTFEKFRELTGGFLYPAVVRGMFANTTAVERWAEQGYLNKVLGEFEVKVQQRGDEITYISNDPKLTKFSEAYDEILENEDSKSIMFFPFFKDRQSVLKDPLVKAMNHLVKYDLEVDRIWKGFGAFETHSSMVGHQFSISRKKYGAKSSTTFDWHTEPGSNWFAQVSGTKFWYFMDPKYSAIMSPNHTAVGIRTLQTSSADVVRDYFERLPLTYVSLEPGDLLFNPEWVWHLIKKSEGISFGVAMREFNMTLSLMSSMHYVGVTATTHIFKNIMSFFFGGLKL